MLSGNVSKTTGKIHLFKENESEMFLLSTFLEILFFSSKQSHFEGRKRDGNKQDKGLRNTRLKGTKLMLMLKTPRWHVTSPGDASINVEILPFRLPCNLRKSVNASGVEERQRKRERNSFDNFENYQINRKMRGERRRGVREFLRRGVRVFKM